MRKSRNGARERRTRADYIIVRDGQTVSRLQDRATRWSEEERRTFWGVFECLMAVEVPQQAEAFYLCVWLGWDPECAARRMRISRQNATMARNRGEGYMIRHAGPWVMQD